MKIEKIKEITKISKRALAQIIAKNTTKQNGDNYNSTYIYHRKQLTGIISKEELEIIIKDIEKGLIVVKRLHSEM
jgi:hypothetical protein